MKKSIEQVFSKKFEDGQLFVTARNYNSHLMSIGGGKDVRIKTSEMRKLADFLNETANMIDADKDFTQ